jgi:hypothetical protein
MCSGDRSVVTGYSVAIANLNVAKVVFSLSIAKQFTTTEMAP